MRPWLAAGFLAAAGCAASPYLVPAGMFASSTVSQQRTAAAPPPAYQPQAADFFDPAPGPVFDLCAPQFNALIEQRRAAASAGNPYAANHYDQEIRGLWISCSQRRQMADRQAEDERIAAEQQERQRRLDDELKANAERRRAEQEKIRAREEAQHQADEAEEAKQQKEQAAEDERERRAQAKRAAARAKKAAELSAALEKATRERCGEEPKRSAWDGIYVGLERAFKETAHDPDSIEFVRCADIELKTFPICWTTKCAVRGKNALGAKILRSYGFSHGEGGWTAWDH